MLIVQPFNNSPQVSARPIVEVALHLLELEYGPRVVPYEWSGGVDRSFCTILAEVRSETAVGWGEGGFFQDGDALAVSPELLEPWLQAAAHSLLGQPVVRYRELGALVTSQLLPDETAGASGGPRWRMVRTAPLLWEPAAVALEFALWDLFARTGGIPFRTLCGSGDRGTIPLAACVGALEPGRAARIASEHSDAGFKTIKLKGGRGPSLDLRIVEQVRRSVDDDVLLRLDPNGAYDVGTARRLAHLIEDFGIEYLEEPCPFDELGSFAALRRSSSVPIALDEAVTGPARVVEIFEAEAADVILLEFHQLGGVDRLLKTVAVAEACGLPLGLHTSYVTGVRTAAMLHFAAATPSVRYAPDTLYHDLREDVLATPLELDGGFATVPGGVGIGVEVDPEAVAARARAAYRRSAEERTRRGALERGGIG